MTDEMIVELVLKGNIHFFSELVVRYKEKVFSLSYRFTNDYSEAQDLSQEVFITVFKKLNTYRESSKFSTWLYRVNYNLCIDWIRKNKKRRILNINRDISSLEEKQYNMEDNFIEGQKKEALRNAIDSMDEKYRTVLILFHFQGLSYEDIGEILDVPVKTVETRLYRGRNMLRKRFLKYFGGGDMSELQAGSWTNG